MREFCEASAVRIFGNSLGDPVADDSEHIEQVDVELTLKGLKLIYDRNRGVRRGRRR